MKKEELLAILDDVPNDTEIDFIVNDSNDNFEATCGLEEYKGMWELVFTLDEKYNVGAAKMYEKEVKELEETGGCAILTNGYLYVITDAVLEEGYMVNKYYPYCLEDGPFDGGLCTGSAQDAVEFLL